MSNDRFVRRASRPVAALLLLTGCFHYVPAEVPPLPGPAKEVRVTLSEPQDIPMGDFTLHEVTRIEGVVAASDVDTLDLVAKWLHPRGGRRYDALFGSYAIPVQGISTLEEWRFSGKRTALAVAIGALVGTLAVSAVWRLVQGPRDGDGEIPVLSKSFPR